VPKVVHPKSGPDRFLTRLAVYYATELELPGLADRVKITWNRRMRTAAGRAFFQTDDIELNPKLQDLPEESRDREIFGTFLHELAHLVSYARADGRRILPHGPEWKQACRDLGIPDEDRCHNLDFQPRQMKRRFTYECSACGSVVERVRKIKRAVACYDCCRTHNGGHYDDRFQLVEKVIA
jgi:predicted SprT family Zn-dependent metalloprotease